MYLSFRCDVNIFGIAQIGSLDTMMYVFPGVDTPLCTYQNLESPAPMTILSCLLETTSNNEPEKKVWKGPKAQTKAQKPKLDQASVCFFQEAYTSFMDAYEVERLKVAYATSKRCTPPPK